MDVSQIYSNKEEATASFNKYVTGKRKDPISAFYIYTTVIFYLSLKRYTLSFF